MSLPVKSFKTTANSKDLQMITDQWRYSCFTDKLSNWKKKQLPDHLFFQKIIILKDRKLRRFDLSNRLLWSRWVVICLMCCKETVELQNVPTKLLGFPSNCVLWLLLLFSAQSYIMTVISSKKRISPQNKKTAGRQLPFRSGVADENGTSDSVLNSFKQHSTVAKITSCIQPVKLVKCVFVCIFGLGGSC